MSGLWHPAGMNTTKPLREDTRTQYLKGQLDIISEVPDGSIRFFLDGRLPHILSLIRAAA